MEALVIPLSTLFSSPFSPHSLAIYRTHLRSHLIIFEKTNVNCIKVAD